jgi:hypothetical protein
MISVPNALKARMAAADGPVNWSRVACLAFEQTLAALDAGKGPRDRTAVVARLKASRERRGDALYRRGHDAGRRWAEARAEFDELERLDRLRDAAGTDWDSWFYTGERDAHGACERLVFRINPENDGDRRNAQDFWERFAGDDFAFLAGQRNYVQGFAEGALSVWDAVRHEL